MYDKVIQLYTYIFFQITFQYMLLQDIEYGSLHYIVNLCCLSILCIVGSVREGNGTPLQYSCLENPMDKGAW